MVEKPNRPFQFSFNAFLKADFQGSRVTSDGGLILVRELDERFVTQRTYRTTLGRPSGEEHAVAARGPVAPVGVQR